ncbi:hypothetical protein Hanom_Chr10g00963771 [Helianthus anomalus]
MPSSYPGRHMSLPRLEPSTSEMKWVSVANWASPVGLYSLTMPTTKTNFYRKVYNLF